MLEEAAGTKDMERLGCHDLLYLLYGTAVPSVGMRGRKDLLRLRIPASTAHEHLPIWFLI